MDTTTTSSQTDVAPADRWPSPPNVATMTSVPDEVRSPAWGSDNERTRVVHVGNGAHAAPPRPAPEGRVTPASDLTARFAQDFLSSADANEQRSALAQEHRALVKAKMLRGLSAKEQRRLEMVRWQLDRLDHARSGAALDRLEALVRVQENLGEHLQAWRDEFDRLATGPKRR